MTKIYALIGTLALLAAGCGPDGTYCSNSSDQCVSTGACSGYDQATETCGVGLVCCPVESADAGK